MEILLDPSIYISLLTLTILEIVLGVDNIIVIAILVQKLPPAFQKRATFIGLSIAMITRVLLLVTLSWISHLIVPLFHLGDFAVTGRDIVLFLGGLFLLYKAGKELYEHLSLEELHHAKESREAKEEGRPKRQRVSFNSVITHIVLIDIVFSLDSVITAIGVADEILVMIAAVIIAIIIMMAFANIISRFIEKYPSLKVLALAFLILVGVLLVADGLHYHIDKAYIYSAMGFSLWVTFMNIWYDARKANFLAEHGEDILHHHHEENAEVESTKAEATEAKAEEKKAEDSKA